MEFDRSGLPVLSIQVQRGQTSHGQLILGRMYPGDGTPPVQVADIAHAIPGHPHRFGLLGLKVAAAGSPPWMLAAPRPGMSFGHAVMRTMPAEVIARISGGHPAVFSDLEVADLLRPVLDSVFCGHLVLAGVAAPPTADPEYTPFTPTMLSHWRFIAGEDVAEPLFAGAMTYVSLRVFTNAEFSFVERCGRKLREMPPLSAAADAAGAPVLSQAPPSMRSGFAGRPTSQQLVEMELEARFERGEMLASQMAEAAALSAWLKMTHPKMPQAKPNSIRTNIAARHRQLMACRKSST